MLKKYWDIFGGLVLGILMSVFSEFRLDKIQLCYSIIILVLLCIGFFRMIRQAVNDAKERHTVIDVVIDGHTSIKAVRMASNPTKDGEMLGELTIKLWEGLKRIMKKFKELCDKFKGIVLSIALGILTIVEGYGGYINGLCGGELMVSGVEILPLVTFVASLFVGIISNGWTKEQKAKINAVLKSNIVEVKKPEVKKTSTKTSEKDLEKL